MIVKPKDPTIPIDENQTKITYIQGPVFDFVSHTGAIENGDNYWLHPIRDGFFKCLETCPFPYIKKPFVEGTTWTDSMRIGQGWRNKFWGTWEGDLLLNYNYSITGFDSISTPLGRIECTIVESTASSTIGQSHLKAIYTEQLGFVFLDYTLFTGKKVVIRLVDFKENQTFNDTGTLFKTKKYLKE